LQMTTGQAVSCSFHSCNRTLVLPLDTAVWKIKCFTSTHCRSFQNELSMIILKAIFLQYVLDEAHKTYFLPVAMCWMFVENLSSYICEDAR